MARDRQPILKKCRTLGLDPSILGVNKKSSRNIKSKIRIWCNGKTIL